MKKIMAVLLALFLLSGCAVTAPGEATVPTISAETTSEQETVPTFSAADETNSKTETPSVIPAELARHDKDIVILEANWDVDIYLNSGFRQLSIWVVSGKELDVNDIMVEIPVEYQYTLELFEILRGEAPKSLKDDMNAFVGFTYDCYLNYCGFDWKKLAEKYELVQAIQNKTYESKPGEQPKTYAEAEREYQDYYHMYWDDYLLLEESMLPQFFCYKIAIEVDVESAATSETINELTVTINGVSATLSVGEARLHAENINQLFTEPPSISSYPLGAYAPVQDLSGAITVSIMDFIAEEDLCVTGVKALSGSLDLGQMEVQIMSDKGMSNNFRWDGNTPISVSADSTVHFGSTIVDPRMKEVGFDFRSFIGMEYEVNGVAYQYTYEYLFCHEIDPFEEYAKHFDGIDFTEYYEKYYYPIVSGIE